MCFQCQLMYSDAEFGVDSDFAMKHYLKLRFGRVDVQRQMTTKRKMNASIIHFVIAVKPIKIKYFSILACALGCGIQWKICLCYQT